MLVICFFEFEVVYSLQGYQDIVHILALSDFTGDSFIQLHISDDWLDVVADQRRMSIKGRGGPCVDTIEGYIFVQKIG